MQPFVTTNRQLAFALAVAGCKFAGPEEGGPTMNTYTPGLLRQRGKLSPESVSYKDFEAATKREVESGRAGIVTYFFERDVTFEKAIAAWDKTVAEIKAGEGSYGEIPADVVATVLCIYANSLRSLKAAAFIHPAYCNTIENRTSKGTGKETTITGKGKVWQVNASIETRKKLGIV